MQVKEREPRVGIGYTYFSQHFGASSTSRSMVMSPSDVSRSTDMACGMLCGERVFVAKVSTGARHVRHSATCGLSHHDVAPKLD